MTYCRFVRALICSGVLLALMTVPACTPHRDGSIPVVNRSPLQGPAISLGATSLAAEAYTGTGSALAVFGFEARSAGLVPVRCRIDNRGRMPVYLHPQQAFLIDRQNLAWPLLTGEQVRNRIANASLSDTVRRAALIRLWGEMPGSTGSLAFGLWQEPQSARNGATGLLGRNDPRAALSLDTRQSTARPSVPVHEVGSGHQAEAYLLFPGREETLAAVSLRLGLEIEGIPRSVNVPLVQR